MQATGISSEDLRQTEGAFWKMISGSPNPLDVWEMRTERALKATWEEQSRRTGHQIVLLPLLDATGCHRYEQILSSSFNFTFFPQIQRLGVVQGERLDEYRSHEYALNAKR